MKAPNSGSRYSPGSATRTGSTSPKGTSREPFIEYIHLEREIRDRHRDKIATIAYQPPEWVTNTLGKRPADHNRRAAWNVVIDRALRYRTEHCIPGDAADLLGAPPASSDIDKRVAWIAARRAIQSDLRLLSMAQGYGRGTITIGRGRFP